MSSQETVCDTPIDTTNKFLACIQGFNHIGMLRPPVGLISKEDARVLAAWLFVLADCYDTEEVRKYIDAVANT